MNKVRAIDPVDMTMEIEAGVTLKAAQEAAAEVGCLLPLSISSEGSAQIGGVLATNAGGNNTVRYGNARDLVLGLEVVLPDGQVWNGLRRLHKDNTGYCLRQLFVGSEGTLGIITAAVLKLYPRPRETAVALCALASPEAALDLFNRFQQHDAAAIQAYEYMSRRDRSPAALHPRHRAADRDGGRTVRADRTGDTARRRGVARLARRGARGGDGSGCRSRRRHRREWRAARRALETPRGAFRGAEIGRRLGQERRLGAGVQSAGADPPRDRHLRTPRAGHPLRPVWSSRRRQYPSQSGAARGRRSRGVSRPRSRADGRRERDRARARWQLLSRARHRQIEALHDAGMARRRRTRADATHQSRARPQGPPQPRQAAAVATAAGCRRGRG